MSNLIGNGYYNLCEAIEKGDKVTAQNLILSNAVVNIPKERDNTPLHRAIVKFNDLSTIKMLLANGADIHVKDYDDNTPLNVAIQRNKMKAATLLIKKGALIGENLNSLLEKAARKNNHTIVKMMIKNGIEYNPSINLFTSLQAAISQRNSMMIKAIIPHCGFSKPSDLYIPGDLVMKSDPLSKGCVKSLLKWNFTIHPDSHQNEELVIRAVENGYVPIVLDLLKYGIDVNMVNSKTGLNLLTIACLNKHHEIVEELLKHNADVNITTSCKSFIDVLQTSDGSDTLKHPLSLIDNQYNLHYITCLHISVCNSDSIMTKLLLKYGAKIIDDPKLFKITCLAVLCNNEDSVFILLDHGANLIDIDSQGATFLYQCLDTDCAEPDSRLFIVKLLLETGADIHLQNPGNDFVFEAIERRHRKIAQLFLDYDANVDYISPDGGDTLLHVAIKHKLNVRFIEDLLKCNLPVNAPNNVGQTPLHLACATESKSQLRIINVLLQYDADIHSTDILLMTPLHYACGDHNLEAASILLNQGANPNVTNQKGQTPLHIVCKTESFVVPIFIQLLLDHDANIDAMDKKGWTPLFKACATENHVAVKCLLDNGANVDHTAWMNLTPLLLIAQKFCYNSEIIKILLEHNVNVHCTDIKGNSIIHFIVKENDVDLIERFIDTNVNFNSVNHKGDTPLHVAVKMFSVPMTQCLLKYGAHIDIVNKNNRTPLQEAIADTSIGDQGVHLWNEAIVIALVKQVIKLKIAGLKVNDQDLRITYNSNYGIINANKYSDRKNMLSDIQQFEVECEQEIEKMKTERVGINGLTFCDLLRKKIHLLGKMIDDKIIQQTLELKVCDERFPLYMDIIRSRFREARF